MSHRLAARHRRRAERIAAAAGEDRVWPWWAQLGSDMTMPASRSWTAIGTLASSSSVTVDPHGMVTPDGTWSLEWWVNAEGRWHVPGREASIRQHLVTSAPVLETLVRVPGGDVAATVFAVAGSGRLAATAIVDIDNRSPVPVAVAFAIRPYNPTGIAPVGYIELRDDRTVAVDGRTGILLPRAPARAVWSPFAAGDVFGLLESEAPPDGRRGLSCPDRLAQAAFVYPVPHRTSVRVVLPYGDGEAPDAAVVPTLPGAAAVARSWAVQGRRGLQASLPPGRLADAIEANRCFVLLAAGRVEGDRRGRRVAVRLGRGRGDPVLGEALARWGFGPEAAMVAGPSPGDGRDGGMPRSTGGAAGDVRGTGADAGLLGGPLAPVGEAGDRVISGAARPVAELARLEIAGADPRALDRIRWLLDAASPSWGWPVGATGRSSWPADGDDARARACFLAAAGDLLVRELDPDPSGRPGLAVCSVLPAEWAGQAFDVREAGTGYGVISFAVRWHGRRPALLWELVPPNGVGPVRLVAPGLDPSWSSTELTGEALLAPLAG